MTNEVSLAHCRQRISDANAFVYLMNLFLHVQSVLTKYQMLYNTYKKKMVKFQYWNSYSPGKIQIFYSNSNININE